MALLLLILAALVLVVVPPPTVLVEAVSSAQNMSNAAENNNNDSNNDNSKIFEYIPNQTSSLLRKYDELWSSSDAIVSTNTTSRIVLIPREGNDSDIDSDGTTTNNNNNYRLASVKIFVPFQGGRGADDAFAAFLGIHQFHHQLESSVKYSCNVRLVADVFDTALSPIQATKQFNEILQQDDVPTAILGAFRSAVTSPLAILSGLEDVVQISHASTSIELDIKEQFPYLGRTVPSAYGEARVAVDFLQTQVSSTHFVILSVADTFGSSLEKAVVQVARDYGLYTQSYFIPYEVDNGDSDGDAGTTETATTLNDVLRQVKDSDIKHIFAICSEQQLESLLPAANEVGLMEDDVFWLFSGLDMDSFVSDMSTSLPTSRIAPFLHGSAVLQMQGGVASTTTDQDDVDTNVRTNDRGYDNFLKIWKDALADEEFMSYVDTKFSPNNSFEISSSPGSMRPFMFDAVISLGRSICNANGMNGTQFVTGADVFDAFRSNEDPLQGASGIVKIEPETGSRDYKTVQYVIWNDHGMKDKLDFHTVVGYSEGAWTTIKNRSFVFRDGTSAPPESLGQINVDSHHIGTTARAIGYTLTGISVFAGLMACIWTFVHRKNVVVRKSNPAFLYTAAAGVCLMSLSTIFFGIDETIGSGGQAILNASCKATTGFYFVGLSLLLGSLASKTLALHKAFLDPHQKYLQFSWQNVALDSSLLLSVNVIILAVWYSAFSPEWVREFTTASDRYGRSIESFGQCQSQHFAVFYSTLLILNGCFGLLSMILCFRIRTIETEHEESTYIALSQVAVLQSWCIAIPLLLAIQDNPQGQFLVVAITIFLSGMAVLLLIYLPKIHFMQIDTTERLRQHLSSISKNNKPRNKDQLSSSNQPEEVSHTHSGPFLNSGHLSNIIECSGEDKSSSAVRPMSATAVSDNIESPQGKKQDTSIPAIVEGHENDGDLAENVQER